nr:MAG TPA: hypothetical protein [Caudoviricetes sp.]
MAVPLNTCLLFEFKSQHIYTISLYGLLPFLLDIVQTLVLFLLSA